MGKFKFNIEAGALYRKQIRIDLERSKDKLEYMYPGSSVTIREEKSLLESVFYIQGVNLPDEALEEIKNWFNKIETYEFIRDWAIHKFQNS